jgi:hypothetical protein
VEKPIQSAREASVKPLIFLVLVFIVMTAAPPAVDARVPLGVRLSQGAATGRILDCWRQDLPAFEAQGCRQHRTGVLESWQAHNSYYALAEIVEGRVMREVGKLQRAELIQLLGTRDQIADYPNAREENFLVWSSHRFISAPAYLIVRFNTSGTVRSCEWVSE